MKSQNAPAELVHIRPATESDATTIARLIFAAFREHARILPPISALGQTPERVSEKLLTASGLIAEYDGHAAGCVFYEPLDDPSQIYLSRLSVAPEHRGRGIASRLIREVERRAIDGGYPRVRLATRCKLVKNVALYERLGYVAYAYGTHEGSDEITTVMMEKLLW